MAFVQLINILCVNNRCDEDEAVVSKSVDMRGSGVILAYVTLEKKNGVQNWIVAEQTR